MPTVPSSTLTRLVQTLPRDLQQWKSHSPYGNMAQHHSQLQTALPITSSKSHSSRSFLLYWYSCHTGLSRPEQSRRPGSAITASPLPLAAGPHMASGSTRVDRNRKPLCRKHEVSKLCLFLIRNENETFWRSLGNARRARKHTAAGLLVLAPLSRPRFKSLLLHKVDRWHETKALNTHAMGVSEMTVSILLP